MMSILFLLSEVLITGASLPILLLAAGWLACRRYRPALRQLLILAHTLLLIGAGLFLLTVLYQLLGQLRGGDEYAQYVMLNRLTGPYWFAHWGAVLCKGGLPQVLWWPRLRRSVGAGAALVPFLLLDYWQPLLYTSLHRDYLPASWAMLRPDYRGLALAGAGFLVVLAAGWLLTRVYFSKLRYPHR
jgi:molybdopterin-containing oxidoreductase family membrane subunit